MTMSSLGFIAQAAELLSRTIPRLEIREKRQVVQSLLDRRNLFLSTSEKHGSPLYALDLNTLRQKAARFREAFGIIDREVRVYYALKSNSHPLIAKTLLEEGINLDVSSGVELQAALDHGANDIIFSGPGKQLDELALAVAHANKVTVLLDSFSELGKLEVEAARTESVIRAGVRLTSEDNGIWRKFGIPVTRLQEFLDEAARCPHVDLCGIQFHISWNLDPNAQTAFIGRLGSALRNLPAELRQTLRFVDVGGGYWPEPGEWLQNAATPNGILQTALEEPHTEPCEHYQRPASSIEEFARRITMALSAQIPSDVPFALCLEPGRWLCHEAMHMLLTVTDVKAPDVVITDGGTNAIGWERFEVDYFPVINLTHPGLQERECLVAGSLCTPHDLWGYSYFGEKMVEGDVLLVPYQGAYTYSLRQEFIKPLPNSAVLAESETGIESEGV